MKMIDYAKQQLEMNVPQVPTFQFEDPEQAVEPISWILCVHDYNHACFWIDFKVEQMFRLAEQAFEDGIDLVQFEEFSENLGLTINLKPQSIREEVAAGMRRLFGVEAFEQELGEQEIASLPELEDEELRQIKSWVLLKEPYDPAIFNLNLELLGIEPVLGPQ